MNSTLLLSIVGKGEAEKLMTIAKKAGSPGGTILRGRGTASNALLSLLCLGESRKEILLTLVFEQHYEAVFDAIRNTSNLHGICAVIPSKRGHRAEGVQTMHNEWEMVQVICTSGYAEDVMDVARKAGAGGGTIIDGRGTSKPDDLKFFGASLVPEKELLMILVEKEKSEKILSAISAIPFMQQEGNGIVFTLPVTQFVQLGHKELLDN
ncbi:P-II family nitrogen regulator [Sphaerochaeta sp. PS]|uniref:P-II family nitrogen regulator n=1 Tax=Sphaerochaeta sp. PS TaxID=3076336 RepID=UPI0028A41FFA|nr:P-II family nitrogen regulator [Sphaerochaeta sp. PS]MDT4761060.1 P-II family nitrogen regulator [Sphaerochaeta sp. PS]